MAEEKNGENPDGGNSEFEDFQRLLKHVLSVPKEKVDEQKDEHSQTKRAK